MITIFLIISLIISLGLFISCIILIKRLLKKIQTYEKWILEFKNDVNVTINIMRTIDKQGTFASSFKSNEEGIFESDDQVGEVFKKLLDVIEKLNNRTQ